MGTLLMFKLLTFLKSHDAATHVFVRLQKGTSGASGLYTQMGFQASKKKLALYLDMSTDEWKEEAKARLGGVVEVMEETEALPVSTQDGLVNSIWSQGNKQETPSDKAGPSDEVGPSVGVQKFGPGANYLGRRVTVRGNGTCWLYAVMAALGVLEHANPRELGRGQEELAPTDADYKLSAQFLQRMRMEIKNMRLNDGNEANAQQMEAKEIATKEKPFTSCYGGGSTDYCILSFLLECNILKLDLANPSKIQLFNGSSKGKLKTLTRETLPEFLQSAAENGEPTLVVEFNGEHGGTSGHFAAYESPESYKPDKPVWLRNFLSKRPVR